MTHWGDDFLEQCLICIPQSPYRERARLELADHLDVLAAGLEEAGLPSDTARAAALERMGDPAHLARRYQREWRRRSLSPRVCAPLLKEGVLQAWAGCMLGHLIFIALGGPGLGVAYALESISEFAYSSYFATVVYLPGLIYGAWSLARLFSGHPYKKQMVGAGLLLAWAAEKIPWYPLLISICVAHKFPSRSVWEKFLVWVGERAYPYLLPSYFAATLVLTAAVWGIAALARRPKAVPVS